MANFKLLAIVNPFTGDLDMVAVPFGAGITTLNGLSNPTQLFAVGSTGVDFNISSSAGTHTFNIPSASSTARGLITTGIQSIAGVKTFTSDTHFNLGANMASGSAVDFFNPADTFSVSLKSSPTLGVNITYELPPPPAASGYILSSTTGGVMSWISPSAGAVTSVSNSDGTLTISPTTGAVVASRSAITGDVGIPVGSNTATLANSGVTAGTYLVTGATIDSKGRVTSAQENYYLTIVNALIFG
jgi:hypothetical protein